MSTILPITTPHGSPSEKRRIRKTAHVCIVYGWITGPKSVHRIYKPCSVGVLEPLPYCSSYSVLSHLLRTLPAGLKSNVALLFFIDHADPKTASCNGFPRTTYLEILVIPSPSSWAAAHDAIATFTKYRTSNSNWDCFRNCWFSNSPIRFLRNFG